MKPYVWDEVGVCTMSSCVSSQPSCERAAPHDELGGGGGSHDSQRPCEALRGLSSLSIHLGMESFIVVTECEPTRMGDLGLAPDQPLEAECSEVSPEDHTFAASLPGPGPRSLLTGRQLSLQEPSQLHTNGRGLSSSPVGSPQSSPRLPRRPTVESHHVSITGLQVCEGGKVGLPMLDILAGSLNWHCRGIKE